MILDVGETFFLDFFVFDEWIDWNGQFGLLLTLETIDLNNEL